MVKIGWYLTKQRDHHVLLHVEISYGKNSVFAGIAIDRHGKHFPGLWGPEGGMIAFKEGARGDPRFSLDISTYSEEENTFPV